jgi:hypothetical protein
VHRVLERTHGFVDRRETMPHVAEVQIDVIRFQPRETLFQRAPQVLARVAVRIGVGFVPVDRVLAGNDEPVVLPGKKLPR